MTDQEVMQQALEALKAIKPQNMGSLVYPAIVALEAALVAQPVAESAEQVTVRRLDPRIRARKEGTQPAQQSMCPHQHAADDWRLHGGPGDTRSSQQVEQQTAPYVRPGAKYPELVTREDLEAEIDRLKAQQAG